MRYLKCYEVASLPPAGATRFGLDMTKRAREKKNEGGGGSGCIQGQFWEQGTNFVLVARFPFNFTRNIDNLANILSRPFETIETSACARGDCSGYI